MPHKQALAWTDEGKHTGSSDLTGTQAHRKAGETRSIFAQFTFPPSIYDEGQLCLEVPSHLAQAQAAVFIDAK